MKTLYAILPCYNEADNIGNLLEEWEKQAEQLKKKAFNLQIRVINDASTDNTKQVVLKMINKYKNIEMIDHSINKGLCGGINTAVNYFYNNAKKSDLLAIMDGDNTHNPKYIHSMIKKVKEGNDCVIASRYQEGAEVKGLAKYREKLSDIAGIYYKLVLNIEGVKDYTCGYRVYTYDIIHKLVKEFGEEVVKEKSFACMMELLYKIHKVNAKISEVPFELRYDNKKGTSKMKVFTTMRRSIITAIKLQCKYNKKVVITNCLIALFLVLFTLFLSLITNFSPTNNYVLEHDCGIFSYIGYAMQNGLFMYTGAWDNKGPLLYLFYYIGLNIAGNNGVFLVEYLTLLITIIFGYKTIMLLTKSKALSLIGIIYSLCAWLQTNEHGTLSEVFALPFLMIGIFLFVKCMLNNINLSKINIIVWGFCSAALALLRLNILLIFLPLFLIIGFVLIKQKRFKEIGTWILYGILGFVLLIIPIAIYLSINNALIECINTAYLRIMSGFNVQNNVWEVLIAMLKILNKKTGITILMFIFFPVSIIYTILNKSKKRNITYIILGTILMILINLYANMLSGELNMHYYITFIPIIVLLVATCINMTRTNKITKKVGVCLLFIAALVCIYNYYSLTQEIIRRAGPEEEKNVYQIREYILENTAETDKVQMIGGRNEATSANFTTKRLAPTRYSYLPLWYTFTEERKKEIVNEVVEKLIQEHPKLIILNIPSYNEFFELMDNKEGWFEFIRLNYKQDNSINKYIIYKSI